MKKLSLILALLFAFALCSCQKQEQQPTEQAPTVTEEETPQKQEKMPPVEESLRGTILNGKFYLVDGYAAISAFEGWTIKMVYEYSTKLVSPKSKDTLTIGIIHDPDGRDKFEDNTEELKKEAFKNAFSETNFISFEKSEENGIKKVSSVCKVTEDEVSYTVYEYKLFINTDIYTLSYYVYGEELTETEVKTNVASFEYLGQIK